MTPSHPPTVTPEPTDCMDCGVCASCIERTIAHHDEHSAAPSGSVRETAPEPTPKGTGPNDPEWPVALAQIAEKAADDLHDLGMRLSAGPDSWCDGEDEKYTDQGEWTIEMQAREIARLRTRLSESEAREQALREKADAYDRINTPEIADFLAAVKNEALHQRERWGVEDDGGKEPSDWFWLVGYLAGKALHDVKGKRLHHIITTAAALLNWHGHETGHYAAMRPGISHSTSTAPAKDANG